MASFRVFLGNSTTTGGAWVFSVSGGTTFSGTYPPVKGRVTIPAGGASLSGTVNQLHGKIFTADGGFVSGGTTPQVKGKVQVPSGGTTLAGAVYMIFSGNFSMFRWFNKVKGRIVGFVDTNTKLFSNRNDR